MQYEDLLIDQDEAVLTITVNRPEVLNAQSRIMREELDDAFAKAAEDDSVRVVIIAGAGKHFSAGHDLGSPQEMEDRKKRPYAADLSGAFKRSFDQNLANTLRWRDFPKPTIHGIGILSCIRPARRLWFGRKERTYVGIDRERTERVGDFGGR